MHLFFYGTLLDPDLLRRLTGRAIPLVPAVLEGWHRVALPGGRYPTLERARSRVSGAVARVDRRSFVRLAAYEGPRYRLVPVTVRGPRGPLRVRAWVAPGGTAEAWPVPPQYNGHNRAC